MAVRDFTTQRLASAIARGAARSTTSWMPSLAKTRALPVLTGNAAFSPRIDVKEDGASYEISAELPGLEEKDIEITVDDGTLVLRGEKGAAKARKRKASTSARSASTVASSAPSTCPMACRTTPSKPSSKTASSPSTCPRRRRRKRSSPGRSQDRLVSLRRAKGEGHEALPLFVLSLWGVVWSTLHELSFQKTFPVFRNRADYMTIWRKSHG